MIVESFIFMLLLDVLRYLTIAGKRFGQLPRRLDVAQALMPAAPTLLSALPRKASVRLKSNRNPADKQGVSGNGSGMCGGRNPAEG
jgi:hypothetical protein